MYIMKKKVPASFMFVLCAVLLALTGCGSSSSDSTPTPDTTAPTVVSVAPAASSTGIARNAVITVTFSEAVDAATINASTFTLKDSGNNAASGTVSASGTTATFTPAAALNYLTPYTATITTGATDAAGNALVANYTWNFTTVTTPSPLLDAAVLKSWVDNGVVNSTGSSRVVILDLGTAATYTPGHIPGALLADSSLYQNRQEGPAVDVNMVLDGPSMDAFVQKYGIDNNTTIVFTTSSILNATRAYWMFRYWGFPKEKLKLLDGLNTTWKTTYSSSISTGDSPTVTASTYSVKSNTALHPELRASLSEMISVASGSVANAVVLDSRSTSTSGSYNGTPGSTTGVFSPGSDWVVFEGHIAGGKALLYTTMYDGTTLQFKSSSDLTAMFATVGIDSTKTTYNHCRTGVIASLPFFVLDAILDWPAVDYDGSWSQWGQMSADTANGGRLAAGSPWITDTIMLSEGVVYNHATNAVELLTLNGSICSGQTSTADVIADAPTGCTASSANDPDSFVPLDMGNQIEDADAAYMGH
jgi:thiosulfate/3-mercaptopyruvate sulfurtransferase